ncbi:MAG: lipase family protein [Coriobacteriia bacterium]|nr:lipase family protein [Coriobacteriia bacterium]
MHKGFEIAANRVEYALNDYLNKYVQDDANTNRILFISGHSRGAGVANIVGRDFEDLANAKTFTYTFAAPNTTDDVASKLNYSTIFNIMNMDDIVCQIPCTNMGYDKYGRDVRLSISTGKSISGGDLENSFKSIMIDHEYDGNTPTEIAEFVELLKKNINKGTREQIYEIDKDKDV